MEYGTCTCQRTCEDPKGESGCHGDCSDSEGCVCPDGFSMRGSDCVRNSQCGCFLEEANLVIPVSIMCSNKVKIELVNLL